MHVHVFDSKYLVARTLQFYLANHLRVEVQYFQYDILEGSHFNGDHMERYIVTVLEQMVTG